MEDRKSVIICPFYAIGHITPLIVLSKKLASRGIKVLFVFPGKPLYDSLDLEGMDISLHVVDFQDGFDEDINTKVVADGLRKVRISYHDKLEAILDTRLKLIRKKFDELKILFPVSAAILDIMMVWSGILIENLGVPVYCFSAMSAAGFLGFLYSFSEENSKNWKINSIPGLPALQPCDIDKAYPVDHPYFRVNSDRVKWCLASDGMIFNSFYDIEPGPLDAMTGICKRVFEVGPLVDLNAEVFPSKQDEACKSWLDEHPAKSVLFICFGSWLQLPQSQLREIAHGVEASGHHFLWVLQEQSDWMLEFQARTKEQGMMIFGWAPQQLILRHPAVAAFVFTSGWNSVLESVVLAEGGISLVAWPLFLDHFMTCRYLVDGAKIAAEVVADENGIVREDEVARVIKLVMTGTEADKMRERVSELKQTAERAVASQRLDAFVSAI